MIMYEIHWNSTACQMVGNSPAEGTAGMNRAFELLQENKKESEQRLDIFSFMRS